MTDHRHTRSVTDRRPSPARDGVRTKRFAKAKVALAAIVITVAILAAAATSASADSYQIKQCDAATGAGLDPNVWRSWNNSSGWQVFNSCASGFGVSAAWAAGWDAGWYTALPTGLYIDGVSYSTSAGNNDIATYAMLCRAGGSPVCSYATRSTNLSLYVGQTTANDYLVCNDCPGFQVAAMRSGSVANGWYSMYGMTFTLDDHGAPWVGDIGGQTTLDVSGGWNRGAKIVQVGAADAQGGVKSTHTVIDGQSDNPANVTSSKGCDYRSFTPCATVSSDPLPLQTTRLSDGAHTLRFYATDAGDNTSSTAATPFKVDNTKPDEPASTKGAGDGLAGYSATNDFDITWTNGAETVETATQSGISHVVLDLEPVDLVKADPPALVIPVGRSVAGVRATIDALSGVSLPEKGEYRYGLGLRDRAGNWSGNVIVDSDNNPTGVAVDPANSRTITWNDSPPPAPSLRNNGWVSEAELLSGYSQEWSINIPMGSPAICGYAAAVTDNQVDDPGTSINVTGDVDRWQLPKNLGEGIHWVHLRSIGCNLLPSPLVAETEVKVDRTDPVSSYAGVTDGGWYKEGAVVQIAAADALSGMDGTQPPVPFYRGAYLDYSINGEEPSEPARGGTAELRIAGEGQKRLRFTAVDLAGNRNDETVVDFGIDGTKPTGHLERPETTTPTLLRAPLADAVSGVQAARFEVRRDGDDDWIALPTALTDLTGAVVAGNPKSAMASARFPDTTLPEDRYEVRVHAYDQAGNELVADRDKHGNPLIVDSGRMRSRSVLSASLFKAKRTCRQRQGARCVRRAGGRVVLVGGRSNLTVGYKRGAVVQGFLVDADARPLSRRPVEIYTIAKGKDEILAGTTSTRADGSYAFKLEPGLSRRVRVHYPGTETRRDTSATVTLGTGAKLVLRASNRHARSGQTVTFSGAVTSYDRVVPAGGKIVALQFYAAKKWRPAVAIARTDSKGRFAVRYKFDGRAVKARIVFRVMAPAEEGWGHATSASRRITMTLN